MSAFKVTRKTTPCCRTMWLWEVLAGWRVFRDIEGRKIYHAKCSSCCKDYELDGGKA